MSQAALRNDGTTRPFTNSTGGTLANGALVFFGAMCGVLSLGGYTTAGAVQTTLANGAEGIAIVKGVVQLAKVPAVAVKSGAPAFWDVGNARATPVAEGNVWIGSFVGDIAASPTYCFVSLNDANFSGIAGAFQPFRYSKQAVAASGNNALFTTPFKMELVDYYIISRTTGAANFKLIQGVTDMTAVLAKGTADDIRVQGVSFIESACIVDAGVAIIANLSAAEEVDVHTEWRAA